MNLFLLIIGLSITGIAAFDIVYTTFAPNGPSVISGRVTNYTWKVMHIISDKTDNRSFLNGAGVVIICMILMSWIVLIWLGHFLIFSSDPQAVIQSSSKIAASYPDRIYYTGYVLSTMGNGDFKAGTNAWQVYTAVVSFFGLILITIAISYMVPVLSAVTDRRTLSIQVASLGHSPESILLNHWDGNSFVSLEKNLMDLKGKIALHGQLHLSYPILQYFQNNKKLTALLPNLMALDEALIILRYMVDEQKRPRNYILDPFRIIMDSFFDSFVRTSPVKDTAEVPFIRLNELLNANIPLKTPSEQQLAELNKRRLLLNKILESSGWYWEEIYNDIQTSRFN